VRAVEGAALAGMGLGALYLVAHLLSFEYGRDQGIYAVVADVMRGGGAPYRDAWDFKPPAIYFFFALARTVFGEGMHAVRLLEAMGLASLCHAFIILSRRHTGDIRGGVIGGAAAVLGYVTLDFWHTAQPETFGAVVLAWAWVAATHRGARQFAAWYGAGALYGVAALLKPSLGGGALASAAIVLWTRRHVAVPKRRRFGAPLLAFFAGGVTPVALTLAYFAAKGALGDVYSVFMEFTPGYAMLGANAAPFPARLGRSLGEWLFRYTPVLVVALVPLLFLRPLHAREREGIAHVFGTILIALAGVAMQAKFFAYHFGAVVPLAGLLTGWGVWKVWRAARHRAPARLVVPVVLVVAGAGWIPGLPYAAEFWGKCAARQRAFTHPAERRAILDRVYSKGDVNMAADRAAAEWLRANTAPGATVFIWGFEPVVYDLADRRPASRYIYNVPQRAAWFQDGARARLMQDLAASDPAAVIVVRNDRLERVTGNDRDSAGELAAFPGLRNWLEARYRVVGVAEDLTIHARRAP
jgi:hypothetical protein